MSTAASILVLEDDPDLREALGAALSEDGYRVVLARRGEEAVKLSTQEEFDLVVSDIKMPGIDGLEAVEQMQGHQPQMKSVIVSGFWTDKDSLRAENLGVSEVINKPFCLDDLLHRIGLLLDEKNRRQAGQETLSEMEKGALSSVRILVDSLGGGKLLQAGRRAAQLGEDSDRLKAAFFAELVTLLAGLRKFYPDMQCPIFGEEIESWVLAVLSEETLQESELIFSRLARTSLGMEDSDTSAAAGSRHLQESTPASRNLLSLGKAMEAANDIETAHRSYSDLITQHAGTKEEIWAHLGLCRIALLAEDTENLAALCEATLEASARRADTLAGVRLELGLLLMRELPDLSRELLKDASRTYASVQDSVKSGYTQLALCAAGVAEWGEQTERSLSWLTGANQARLLKRSLPWLLPLLLELSHPAAKLLQTQFPRELLKSLNSGDLSPKARMNVAETLKTTSPPASGSILRLLAEDPVKEVSHLASRLLHIEIPDESPPLLRILTFGPFEVYFGASPLASEQWKRKKLRIFLAYLASAWRTPRSEDLVLEEFWPGPADRAKRSLYQATWEIRRALKPENWEQIDYIQRLNGFLSINRQYPVWIDIEEFESTLDRAKRLGEQGQSKDAASLYSEAIRLARGPYLEGCYEDWIVRYKNSVELGLIEAREAVACQAFEDRDFELALENANELLALDSLHLKGQLLTMDSLIELGRFQEAQQRFRLFKRELQDELQLEPSLDLLRAYQRAEIGMSGPSIG